MRKENIAVLCVILAGTLWATLGITIRILTSYGLTSAQIVVARFCAAAIAVGAYLLLFQRDKLRIEKKDIKIFIALGVFCILFYNICFTITVSLASLSVATALLYTSPIWAMLISIFVFKEKLTKKKVTAICLCIFGCSLITGVFSGSGLILSPLGVFTGFLAGVGYGSYGVFAKVLVRKYHYLTVIFYMFLVAGLSGLAICRPINMARTIIARPVVIFFIFVAAFFCILLPYLLYTFALGHVMASRAAVIVSFELVMATVFGAIIYNEKITVFIAIGIVSILSAITVLNSKSAETDN